MFWVIKTLHEGRDGDFPREFEGRFFKIGKNVVKKRSVFLHATIRHVADGWWTRARSEDVHVGFPWGQTAPVRGRSGQVRASRQRERELIPCLVSSPRNTVVTLHDKVLAIAAQGKQVRLQPAAFPR